MGISGRTLYAYIHHAELLIAWLLKSVFRFFMKNFKEYQ